MPKMHKRTEDDRYLDSKRLAKRQKQAAEALKAAKKAEHIAELEKELEENIRGMAYALQRLTRLGDDDLVFLTVQTTSPEEGSVASWRLDWTPKEKADAEDAESCS